MNEGDTETKLLRGINSSHAVACFVCSDWLLGYLRSTLYKIRSVFRLITRSTKKMHGLDRKVVDVSASELELCCHVLEGHMISIFDHVVFRIGGYL